MPPFIFMILARMGEKLAEEVGKEVVKTVAKEVWGDEIKNDSEAEKVLGEVKTFLTDNNLKL